MSSPPFANLAAYATKLGELVPDAKAASTDSDFVEEALKEYASDSPLWQFADVGDGAQFEWELGKAAEPFADFEIGFSDRYLLRVELLDSGDLPQRPQIWVRTGWWVEDRTVAGVAKQFLVFESAPATAAKYRVGWRTQRAVEVVPEYHQMAVIYLAAAAKCGSLSVYYKRMVDSVGGSDVFSAIERADSYGRAVGSFRKKAARALNKVTKPKFTTGVIRSGKPRVFQRGMP